MATKPDPLNAQAKALVDAMFSPVKASLEAQRQQALAEAQARQQGIQGFAQAAAQQVAPIAGQVQDGYQEAGGRTATYSKGFSIGMQLAQQNSANDLNSFLAKQGAPQGQMVQAGPGAADVLYGSTGFIPASGLEREGAAFGAAAAMLPATMLGRGQRQADEARREAEKVDRGYFDKLAEIEAARPGEIQKALLELRDLANKERAQRLNEEIAVQELGIKKANLGLAGERVKISAANAETARYNAELKRLQNDRSFQTRTRALGLQEAGLGLRAAELEARLKPKTGKKGLTPKEIRDLKREALETVQFGREQKYGYQQMVLDMVAAGIPLSIAQAALNRYWKVPGRDGRPYVKFQNRKPKKKR